VLIARRGSGRQATDFPVGTRVLAQPATVSRRIAGTVVDVVGPYTLVVEEGGIEIVIDVEDCAAVPSLHPGNDAGAAVPRR
jgi:hypothetical protein